MKTFLSKGNKASIDCRNGQNNLGMKIIELVNHGTNIIDEVEITQTVIKTIDVGAEINFINRLRNEYEEVQNRFEKGNKYSDPYTKYNLSFNYSFSDMANFIGSYWKEYSHFCFFQIAMKYHYLGSRVTSEMKEIGKQTGTKITKANSNNDVFLLFDSTTSNENNIGILFFKDSSNYTSIKLAMDHRFMLTRLVEI